MSPNAAFGGDRLVADYVIVYRHTTLGSGASDLCYRYSLKVVPFLVTLQYKPCEY